jgi:acetylornithine deacetylase
VAVTLPDVESHVDEERLVALAVDLVSIPSPTGDEQAMGERVQAELEGMGLQVQWQEVEEGRPNVLGIWEGAGGGPSLMFNGHMDTSYSGREPWLRGIRGFQPEGFVQDGRIYGLGISNMKGALCCYVEAVRALQDSGVRLRGDVLLACVAGEIEKTQWGEEFRGREYRGYAAGSRFLTSFGGVADMCILGEPTEQKVVLGHFGALWLRISTRGPFVHTAFAERRTEENSIVRMQDVLAAVREWIPQWEERTTYRGLRGIVGIGAIDGGFAWRASRTPHRTDLFLDVRVPPTLPMARARAEVLDFVRSLRERFPEHGIESEIYVTAPGSEIDESHPLIGAIDAGHEQVFGAPPERDVVRWFSDASALTRYGIESVNYGTSSGLPDPVLGENLDIEGLVRMAKVYALVAARVCEVAA